MGNSTICGEQCFRPNGIWRQPGAVMSGMEYPEWQKPYREAALEIDPGKLPERLADAETTIFLRLLALQEASNGHIERAAINKALTGLRILQKEKLNYPDW
jgi:hypothetical protein